MKVYIAHNFAAQKYLQDIIVPIFKQMGHIVTSRWVYEPPTENPEVAANQCIQDLMVAEVVVLFAENLGSTPGRGKYIEFGLALATNKHCIVVAPIERDSCVFFHLPSVVRLDNIGEVIAFLQGEFTPD